MPTDPNEAFCSCDFVLSVLLDVLVHVCTLLPPSLLSQFRLSCKRAQLASDQAIQMLCLPVLWSCGGRVHGSIFNRVSRNLQLATLGDLFSQASHFLHLTSLNLSTVPVAPVELLSLQLIPQLKRLSLGQLQSTSNLTRSQLASPSSTSSVADPRSILPSPACSSTTALAAPWSSTSGARSSDAGVAESGSELTSPTVAPSADASTSCLVALSPTESDPCRLPQDHEIDEDHSPLATYHRALQAVSLCKGLEKLGLNSWHPEPASLAQLASLPNLGVLTLEVASLLSSEALEGLACLSSLAELRLFGMSERGCSLGVLGRLAGLRNLTVKVLDVELATGEMITTASSLTALESLQALSTRIPNAILQSLHNLKSLECPASMGIQQWQILC
eukprot:gene6743-3414_t